MSSITILAVLFLVILGGCVQVGEEPSAKGAGEIGESAAQTEQLQPEEQKESIPTQPEPKEEKPVIEEIEQEDRAQTTDIGAAVPCDRLPTQREVSFSPYYTGPLFDAHFHMPIASEELLEQMAKEHGEGGLGPTSFPDPVLGKDVTLDEILCFFDKEGVRGAIGFYIPNEAELDEALASARTIKEQSSGRINLFLMPAGLEAGTLDSIQVSNPELFKGYGELAFYDQSFRGVTPSDKKMLDIYDIAEKHGLVVMMHPDLNQESHVEKALQNNPEVNFLLHGFEIEGSVSELMDRYPNVYFSLDSAVLYPMMGLFISGPKELFVSRLDRDFDSILNEQVNRWKKAVERHPDRFVWGTDRGPKWHFDEEVSILLEEFARAFIARLDPEVQEKIAYKNAERLLQGR